MCELSKILTELRNKIWVAYLKFNDMAYPSVKTELYGTDELKLKWTKYKGNTYKSCQIDSLYVKLTDQRE